MAFDSHDSYVVLFGGCTVTGPSCPAGGVSGDTWKFAAGLWTQLIILGPPARYGASMADYKAGDTNTHYVLLFGGCLSTGSSCTSLAGDTWKYVGGVWTQLHPTPAPSARYYASMSWDTSDGYIVLTAGCGLSGTMCPSGGPLRDTWTWAGTWRSVGTTSLTPRYAAAISDDPVYYKGVILYGGCVVPGSGCPNTPSAETWGFKAGVWTLLYNPSPPGYLMGAVMAQDVSGIAVVLYGGCALKNTCNALALATTWLWTGSWAPASPTYSPAQGYFAEIAWDAVDGYDLYLDGCTSPGSLCPTIGTNTWTYTTTVWNEISQFLPGPSGQYGAALAYDPLVVTGTVHGAVILFGGCSTATCPMGDTWQFERGTWTQLSPTTSPPARFDASVAFDAADNYLLLLGGCSAAPVSGVCPSTSLLGDYWEFVAGTSGGSWTQLFPCPTCTSPSARSEASMAYDSSSGPGKVILFGGYVCTNPPTCTTGGPSSETWSYHAGTWTQLHPRTSPAARYGASTTFDAASGVNEILLFGGFDGTSVRHDLWNWTPVTPTWTLLSPSGGPPAARFQAMFVYDALDGYDLLFGGCTAGTVPCPSGLPTSALSDSWKLTSASTWSQLSPTQSPPARSDAGMDYDAVDSEVVLFGGSGILGSMTDTWLYASGTWGL